MSPVEQLINYEALNNLLSLSEPIFLAALYV